MSLARQKCPSWRKCPKKFHRSNFNSRESVLDTLRLESAAPLHEHKAAFLVSISEVAAATQYDWADEFLRVGLGRILSVKAKDGGVTGRQSVCQVLAALPASAIAGLPVRMMFYPLVPVSLPHKGTVGGRHNAMANRALLGLTR
jgi:hypothetical protein